MHNMNFMLPYEQCISKIILSHLFKVVVIDFDIVFQYSISASGS